MVGLGRVGLGWVGTGGAGDKGSLGNIYIINITKGVGS